MVMFRRITSSFVKVSFAHWAPYAGSHLSRSCSRIAAGGRREPPFERQAGGRHDQPPRVARRCRCIERGTHPPRPRADLPQPRHQDDRAVRPRRTGRHHGAARRPATVHAARPERDHRQPRWRRRHHRCQGRRGRRARRLYADVRQHRDLRGRTCGLRQHRLRPDQEFRADRAVLDQHQSLGHRPEAAGAIGCRADCPRQGQPRQDQLRLARLRHAAAHDRRDVQAARLNRRRARALQRAPPRRSPT